MQNEFHITKLPWRLFMKNLLHLLVLLCLFSFTSCSQMPTESTQAIIGIAEDWNSSHVTLS